jgi:hypothetical protein
MMNLRNGFQQDWIGLDGFSQAVLTLTRVLAEHRYMAKNG